MLSGQQVLNGGFEEINLNEFNPEDPYPEHWLGWHGIMGFLPFGISHIPGAYLPTVISEIIALK